MPWNTQASILRRHALHLFISRFLPFCWDLPDVYIHTYIYIYICVLSLLPFSMFFFFFLYFSQSALLWRGWKSRVSYVV